MRYGFAFPIRPGQTEALRQLFAEVAGPRRADFADMQRRTGVTEEAYWLQRAPDGDRFVMVSDSDQRQFAALMAAPQTDFDRWFSDQIGAIFGPPESAPDQPAPLPELLLEWRA